MIVTTAELFGVAYGQFAVGAYNINNMEQALGLFRGHAQARAPFIVQLSKGARKYAGVKMLEGIIRACDDVFPDAVYAVHLDHGDEKTCYDAIDSGFYSSVMIDASQEPFEENAAITRRVVERAHERGVSVEAELGVLGGVEEHIKVDEKHAMLTDPDEAKEFVERTGCDSLAVAIGTSHGAYKFTGSQGLHFERIAEIQRRLPGFPLVMHGSSSVPREEVERINAAGGTLDPSARGVDENEFATAVPLGVTKVNIDTDGRLVWTRVHREHFRDHPENFDFRKPGETFIQAYADFIEHKAEKLLSAGTVDATRDAIVRGRALRQASLLGTLPATAAAAVNEGARARPGRPGGGETPVPFPSSALADTGPAPAERALGELGVLNEIGELRGDADAGSRESSL